MSRGKNIPTYEPKSVIESIELLEDFLCAELDYKKDWTIGFLRVHFYICKKEVKQLMLGKKQSERE